MTKSKESYQAQCSRRLLTKEPVGKTVFAKMCKEKKNASLLVLLCCDKICHGVGGITPSTKEILLSFLRVFIGKRMSREIPFSNKDFQRFLNSMKYTLEQIIKYSDKFNQEQAYCKYWLDLYLGKVLKDCSPPTKPSWISSSLFSGWCKNFILRCIARRDVSFVYSLQKGSKQAWPSLGPYKRIRTENLFVQRLSTPRGVIPQDMRDEVYKTSVHIFGEMMSGYSKNKFLPTGSACSQASRRLGGALSLFKPLSFQNLCPKLGLLPSLSNRLETWRNKTYAKSLDISLGDLRTKYNSFIGVSYTVIPEPGKFRIVTAGNGGVYSALQPLQGAMLDCWKRSKHSTMRDDDLLNKVKEVSEECSDLPFWASGDFEAATDLELKDLSISTYMPLYNALKDSDELVRIGLSSLSEAHCGLDLDLVMYRAAGEEKFFEYYDRKFLAKKQKGTRKD